MASLENRLAVWAYRLRRGGGSAGSLLLLTTHGRVTGNAHTVPLRYLREGNDFVVVGSNLGNDRMPSWQRNLEARPDAEIRAGAQRIAVRAETLAGDERQRAWERFATASPGYAAMQAKTTRTFPVARLVPLPDR
ncbi:MAG: nitroreductase/quinone reductase family protein [Ktedonobacterales bacterium]